METVGTASSILKTISVGITVCEGLFFYLDSRKGDYKTRPVARISSSYRSIQDISVCRGGKTC